MFYHETMGTMADESKLYKTFSFRVKDSTSGKQLVRLGTKVNFVWNYCNDVSKRSAQRGGPWVGKKQLIDLTKGSSKEIGLPSQIVQNVVFEFIKSRKAAGKPKLRWHVSRGAKRSLGWIPFTNQDVTLEGGTVKLRGETLRLWMHRELTGRIKSGNFSQDSRGRWYCNLVCEVEAPKTTNRTKVVGIDLGFKTVASSSDGRDLEQANFYRDLEAKLADAQRRNKKRLVKTIHAKIKNRRKDALHKYSRAVVNDAGAVFVGNISSTWQVASGNGKAALDVSWSMLKNFLRYKCDHAGVVFAEVNEAYTTQTCSRCHARSGPQGVEDLDIRRWTCSECAATHGRDRNAAINIARLGSETLGLH